MKNLVPEGHVLAMRIYVAEIDCGIYYDISRTRDVVIWNPDRAAGAPAPDFISPNTTTLVELKVDRVTEYVTLRTTPRRH